MIADLSRPYNRRRHPWERERRFLMAALGAVVGAIFFLILLSGVAYGGTTGGTQTVRVQRGDTVWSIAGSHYSDGDLRARVDDILATNHLSSPLLVPGQQLLLPPP
jgi:nucleoid-associated protein YgaU